MDLADPAGMDALELLKQDHDRVRSYVADARNIKNGMDICNLFDDLSDELYQHMYVEETVFYPMFSRYDEFKDLLDDSYQDHQQVKAMLAEMNRLKTRPDELKSRIEELWQEVESHFSTEENEFFPRVRQLLKRPEREQLGRHLVAAKMDQERKAA